ncbi:MAG: 16S rRNA (cytosine(967)-C(5))-methyltransferase RsmB [Firmicutes bacterium]|nr:16S rRNA (cytosine(967)-C(5))-methyltransferase RsmB [Bacillota bacterium]
MTVSIARQIAFRALSAIEQKGAYTHLALRAALEETTPQPSDAALASEIVHGVTVWRRLLDHWIETLTKDHSGHMQHTVRTLLRMALYQMRFLERVPPYAVVNDAVEQTKIYAQRAAGFVNGVLRAALRQTAYLQPARTVDDLADCAVEQLALRLSYPDWLAQSLIATYGRTVAISAMVAMNESPVRTVRVNRLVATREEVLASLAESGVQAEACALSPEGIRLLSRTQPETIPDVMAGRCTLQGESSMLVAPVLAPKPGQKVLDACAAPGGKATHLAELSLDQADITAMDLHEHRARAIARTARHLGLHSVRAVTGDAREVQEDFDAILLDAPCSGIGTIARKSDLKWTAAPLKTAAIVQLQRELLSALAKRVKPGGKLLYSTCTLLPEENEQQREQFLRDHPDFVAEPFDLPGLRQIDASRSAGADGQARIWPQDFGGDGFYLALFRRIPDWTNQAKEESV